jgi:ABC-type amino acid transport/signal transduction systems, periplasmic component/domain
MTIPHHPNLQNPEPGGIMYKRKMAVATAVAASLLALAACSSSPSAPSTTGGSQAFQTTVPGTLTIATEIGNPGWVDGTSPTNITGGVEYQMAKTMAKDWNLKLEIRNVSFTPLVSGAVTGYDIGLMTIFNTPARQKVNQYSKCYYPALTGVLVKKGTNVTTVAEAKKLQWGYVTGGYAGLILQQLKPDQTPKSFQDGPTEYAALESGTVQGIMDDLSSVAGRSQQAGFENTHVTAIINAKGLSSSCSAAQLPQSAPKANVTAVNAEIDKMTKNGDLANWEKQYLSKLGQNPNDYPQILVP